MIFQNFYKVQPQNMKNFVITFLALFSISSVAFEEFLITDIRIVGLQRVSIGSIFTAIPVSVGDKMDQGKVSEITRALFSTAQFNDIQIAKDGSALIISVLERPSISKIQLEGNKALKSEDLLKGLERVLELLKVRFIKDQRLME